QSEVRSGRPNGKAKCKAALQEELGLPVSADVLLIGTISRLTDQKGFDLIEQAAGELLRENVQLCILGTGDERYETFVRELAREHPRRAAVSVGFDEALAHRIEAGCDAYLMPSRYEPCGLNQMYSQIYGTVPIVRAVGGLADSVVDATPETISDGTASGFSFREYQPAALVEAVARAAATFRDRDTWRKLMLAGMQKDWSWRRSAGEYLNVYRQAIERKGRKEAESI
ncbi:MAG: glycosyltransferase, partial [Planctomycetes bacterium]|nr:glycosyltransferase [Planctomycetota bacterium]